MNNYWKHFKTIVKHKWYVFDGCRKSGVIWQGLVHDLSKFSPVEFITSAQCYQGSRSPIDFEREQRGYSKVWINHKAKNKHHPHYWIDIKDNQLYVAPMPLKYAKEMVCDWCAAGRVYNGETNISYLKSWYERKKNEGRTSIHPMTERQIELWLKRAQSYEDLFNHMKNTYEYEEV